MTRSRLIAVVAASSLAVAIPARSATAQGGWQAAVAALVQKRTAAVVAGDANAFEDTMALAPDAYKNAQRVWFSRIRKLPIASYSLESYDGEYGDLARAKDHALGDEVHILQLKERLAVRGYDTVAGTGPSDEDILLTVVRRGSRWSVAGDTQTEDLGLLSDRNLWDFGDIDTLESNGVMIVFHPAQRGATATIMREAQKARARARGAWPYAWSDPIIVMVPSTVDELARILQTTFDLSTFVAFAASSVDRSKAWHLVGNRVFLHWENFRRYQESFQQRVLAHEFTHLATRSMSGPFVTAILDEGIAQLYGEGGGQGPDVMRRRIRSRALGRTLVPDWYFTAGPSDDIHLAYEEAASFVKYIAGRFGKDAPAQMYHAVGEIDPVSPGASGYHLDRVTAGLFHQPFASLEKGWFDAVSKELS